VCVDKTLFDSGSTNSAVSKQVRSATAVVAKEPAVGKGLIKMEKIRQASLKSPPDDVFGDMVSARADSKGDTL
jgi:hypothetical protein